MFVTETGKMVLVEIDARVGGTFSFVDRRDGEDVVHTGEYLEIDRPHRLAFTLSAEKYGQEIDRVVIEITRLEVGCELTLTHEMSPAWVDRKELMEQGWAEILESAAETLSLKEMAVSFLRLVATGKVREAYRRHIGPGFRHHNPFFRGDADSLMLAMEENAAKNPHKILEVKRALEEGDIVAVHSHVKQKQEDLGGAVVHIFRFNNDRIVEFWDLGQPIPENSPNENGMF